MIDIVPVPAFTDNYIWMLFDEEGQCVVIDPGQAEPVLAFLHRENLTPSAILLTHHHADHTGGVAALCQHFPVPVYGPAAEHIAGVTHPLTGGESVHLTAPRIHFRVISVPGHTRGHLAYFMPAQEPPALFAGDTLFSGGCGRIFEGTPADMLASLDRLAGLPDSTRLYCAHEYTQRNLEFATQVCPDNVEMRDRLHWVMAQRKKGLPTLPSTLAIEHLTNPFLRLDAVEPGQPLNAPTGSDTRVDRFAQLRHRKDGF